MTTYSFDAYVTAALFDRTGQALFALGDGTVRLQDGTAIEAHPGAGVLCAASHPSGAGIVTGGDDGRLAWTLPSGAKVLAEAPGRWIEAVAASAASGLIAFSAGKTARIVSANDPAFERAFEHETSVLGLAFDPKGLRVAVAAYGGVWNWYARIAQQKPQTLKWAGIHNDVLFSPDGKFLITALQDAQLHAWRLSDGKDMRMGGYPAKVKSMAFLSDGALLATSGAHGAVIWPFTGPSGPMGREAAEVAFDELSLVERLAGAGQTLVGGRADGRLFALALGSSRTVPLKQDKGAPITALALSADGRRYAWGDEDGAAGVSDVPSLA